MFKRSDGGMVFFSDIEADHAAAGHDVIRLSGPHQKHVLVSRVANYGFSRSAQPFAPRRIHPCKPRTRLSIAHLPRSSALLLTQQRRLTASLAHRFLGRGRGLHGVVGSRTRYPADAAALLQFIPENPTMFPWARRVAVCASADMVTDQAIPSVDQSRIAKRDVERYTPKPPIDRSPCQGAAFGIGFSVKAKAPVMVTRPLRAGSR